MLIMVSSGHSFIHITNPSIPPAIAPMSEGPPLTCFEHILQLSFFVLWDSEEYSSFSLAASSSLYILFSKS